MTGTVAYLLSKKLAMGIASGIASVSLKGNAIVFNFKDGTQGSITVPAPENGKDGVSIVDIKLDENKNLICTMSNDKEINAGNLGIESISLQELEEMLR